MGASTSGLPKEVDTTETVEEYSTPPTTIVNASMEPGAIVDILTTADAAAHSVSYNTNA